MNRPTPTQKRCWNPFLNRTQTRLGHGVNWKAKFQAPQTYRMGVAFIPDVNMQLTNARVRSQS